MTIYLNERVIRFVPDYQNQVLPTDLVINYSSASDLQQVWLDFIRYEKYYNLIIIDPEAPIEFFNPELLSSANELSGFSGAFKAFLALQ